MIFNSLTYAVFLVVVVLCAQFGSIRWRQGLVLAASLAFYGFWRIDFLFLVIFSATVDYVSAGLIHRSTSALHRRVALFLSLLVNLGLLLAFKYAQMLVSALTAMLGILGFGVTVELPVWVLPLGISFYTFQTISYTIDVYRGVREPVRGFGLFLTYVMFWPQLVAGPILRADEVVPQLTRMDRASPGQIQLGFRRVVQGLFKKIVLADNIAPIVDFGFGLDPAVLGTLDVWTLAFAFGLQIYWDFSGYSEIALGSAMMVGIHFPENFRFPYLATSPRDFWKRWHISLSAWIRDYLYLPLMGAQFGRRSVGGIDGSAGRGVSAFRGVTALFLTWFIMGLWHGAAWRFAIWGVWHALLIQAYRQVSVASWGTVRFLKSPVIHWALTIGAVMLGWVFFRADTLFEAMLMVGRAADLSFLSVMSLKENHYLVVFLGFVGLMLHALLSASRLEMPSGRLALVWRGVATGAMLALCALYLGGDVAFIYFQF